ncbi:putative cyclase-domain-containing protein [Xylariaceae sp. FL1019]|nr:putative cyclase-domain-containing protein [Xylariaceae sp. FL1019]
MKLTQVVSTSSLLSIAAGLPSQSSHKRVERRFDAKHDLYANWPSYDALPLNKSYPTKAAWGVWGAKDEHGALNHITPKTIEANGRLQAASSTIREGQAFHLNMRLDGSTPANPSAEDLNPPANKDRKSLQHTFLPEEGYSDDIITMNTQISTQYDGLRHFPYSINSSVETYQWYNDLIPDYEDIIGPSPTDTLGIHIAAEKGIAVRAVVLDFAGWMDAKNESFDAFSDRGITTDELDAVAAWQGMPNDWAMPGDALLIRTGWNKQYLTLNETERWLLPVEGWPSVGMDASEESLRWLWEKKLSIVGADNPAFEKTPFEWITDDGIARSLHQVFIGGWGQSILEHLYLEELAEAMHEHGRWAAFMTIQNLNIVGGIASPPNAMAIL